MNPPAFHSIRVAHVALQLETGGMERLLSEFARHGDPKRVSLMFIALGNGGPVADEIRSLGWPVKMLNAPLGMQPSAVFQLASIFHDQKIDIVHTHNSKPLLYAGSAARLSGVRAVIHTCHGRRQHATPRQNIAFQFATRIADRMVCVSQDIARLCKDQKVGRQSVCTIANGIDLQRFSFRGPAAGGPAIYVGRLSPEKDVASLLHAVAVVVAQCPGFRLQIAGDGVCRSELKTLTQSLGLQRNVDFRGEVRDVTALLHSASMLVLPSLTEGIPLTVLEAMSCGLPVIATRVGGTPEAVNHGVTGLLVSPRNRGELATALIRIYNDPDTSQKMGLAGRARVEKEFDVREMILRYEALYQKVLYEKRRAA